MASPLSAFAAKRAPLETRSWLRQVGRAGPEVWVWPVAAACWLVLAWAALGWYPLGMTSGFGHHLGMAHSAEPSVAVVLAEDLALWTAMVGATMLPLLLRFTPIGPAAARAGHAWLQWPFAAQYLGLLAVLIAADSILFAIGRGMVRRQRMLV